MTGRLVFLLEEPSMKALLDGLLPRLFPGWEAGTHFLCVPHEGKSDLERSIAIKLRSWKIPGDRFVVVRDNDNSDCLTLKARLLALCAANNRPDTLVRLVCQELESWYLGDLPALTEAFAPKKLNTPSLRKRFVDPDVWQQPAVELTRLVPEFQKIRGARLMAAFLRTEGNCSRSFQAFVDGITRIATEMHLVRGHGPL